MEIPFRDLFEEYPQTFGQRIKTDGGGRWKPKHYTYGNIKSKDILKCETFHTGIRLKFFDIEPKMNYYNV